MVRFGFLFQPVFGVLDFMFQPVGIESSKVGVGQGVGLEADSGGVHFADLLKSEKLRARFGVG